VAVDDPIHVALPQLKGGPAYARPPRVVAAVPRPFDPDDLPLLAAMTDEERTFLETRGQESASADQSIAADESSRSLGLRAIAERLRRLAN
jgi:hypothetical protein